MAEIVQIDYGVDNAPSGTMTIDYSLTNRLLARRKMAAGPGVVREVLAVTIQQSRYSDLKAAAVDPNYPGNDGGLYSPMRISATVSPTDTLSGTFQTYIDPKFKKPQTFSASGSITRADDASHGDLVEDPVHSADRTVYGYPGECGALARRQGHDPSRPAEVQRHLYRELRPAERFRPTADLASYSAQCCGVTVDYQTISARRFGVHGYPADRRFGISFSLAGIGSFSNPFGSFGENAGR